jgi:hypothetical protein
VARFFFSSPTIKNQKSTIVIHQSKGFRSAGRPHIGLIHRESSESGESLRANSKEVRTRSASRFLHAHSWLKSLRFSTRFALEFVQDSRDSPDSRLLSSKRGDPVQIRLMIFD